MIKAKWILPVIGILLGTGCRGGGEIVRPNYGQTDAPYQPRVSSGTTFDAYASAALAAEATRSQFLKRTQFSESARAAAMHEMAPMTAQVRAATARSCDFEFRAREPFTEAPYLSGWRLIGRCLAWKTESEARTGSLDAAIDSGLAATRFGFDLTQGDAMTANLGCSIVADARVALLPALAQMSGPQLYRLAQGLKAAIARGPNLVKCAQNEQRQSLVAAQYIYDSARSQDLGALRTQLGAPGDNIANQLSKEANDASGLAKFTDKFAAEVTKIGAIYIKAAATPAASRADLMPKLEKGRPWRILSQNFLGAVPGVQPTFDRTLARTRMFVIRCMLERNRRLGQMFPGDLSKFSESVRTDPYAGRDFGYQSEGLVFRLFANGDDTVDDGGETDEAGTTPDLILETFKPYPVYTAPPVRVTKPPSKPAGR